MTRKRLIPPNPVLMPAAIAGPMPNGDAADPSVDSLALAAARKIDADLPPTYANDRQRRITRAQIAIAEAINAALDRCQALGGRRVL